MTIRIGGGVTSPHIHALADLPVADDGEVNAAELVGAADPRLSNITPDDHNLQTWICDPLLAGDTLKPTSGTLAYSLLRLRRQRTITGIGSYVRTAGATLTSGRNLQAIYRLSDRALLGQTADQSTVWTSTGAKQAALSASLTLDPADYYVITWSTGTTTPTWAAVGVSIAHGYQRTGNQVRGGTNSTVQTALPATLPAASNYSAAIWVGLY